MSKKGEGRSDYIQCPFYKRDYTDRIMCEGPFKVDCSTSIFFRSPGDKRAVKVQRCQQDWRHCPICVMLMDKYKDD